MPIHSASHPPTTHALYMYMGVVCDYGPWVKDLCEICECRPRFEFVFEMGNWFLDAVFYISYVLFWFQKLEKVASFAIQVTDFIVPTYVLCETTSFKVALRILSDMGGKI